MIPSNLLEKLHLLGDSPEVIQQIRKLLIVLAIGGKLVSENSQNFNAKVMLEQILDKRKVLFKNKQLRNQQPPEILPEELPDGLWADVCHFVRLGFIAQVEKGPTGIQKAIPGDYPLVATAEDRLTCDHYDFDDSAAIVPLVSSAGHGKASLNRLHYQEGKFALGSILAAIFPLNPELVSARFLFEYLTAFKDELLVSKMTGTANVTLTIGRLCDVPVPLISPVVQLRIDELMALCDRLQAAQTEREQCRDRLVAASLNRLNPSDQSRRPGRDCRDPDFMDESDLGSLPPDSNPKQQNVSIMEGKQAYFPVNWIPAIPAGTTGFDDVRFVLENLPRLTTRPAHIKQLRQTILNLAVRGKLAPQDSKDEPAAELLNRIKVQRVASELKSKIKNVGESCASYSKPRGWEWCEIEALSKLVTDGEHATPIRIREHEIPLVTAKNVRDGEMDYSITDWVSRETAEKAWKRCKPEVGDILLVCVGATTGRLCILREAKEMVLVRSVALIRPEIGIDVNYLALAIRSPLGQTQIWGSVKATAQPCLYINKINNLSFPLPPLAEQHRIVAKVDELMALCDQLETQLTRTAADSRRLLEALLHEALVPASEQAA